MRLHRPDATFLAWLDVSACGLGDAPAARLLEKAGVAVSEGAEFGTNGGGHVRLNFGTSAAVLDEVLDRLLCRLQTQVFNEHEAVNHRTGG